MKVPIVRTEIDAPSSGMTRHGIVDSNEDPRVTSQMREGHNATPLAWTLPRDGTRVRRDRKM